MCLYIDLIRTAMLFPRYYCVPNENVALFFVPKALLSPTLIGFLQGAFKPPWVFVKRLGVFFGVVGFFLSGTPKGIKRNEVICETGGERVCV